MISRTPDSYRWIAQVLEAELRREELAALLSKEVVELMHGSAHSVAG